MDSPGQRPLRADAARNVERIMRAARSAFDELGGDAALEEIARRAGVGVATLYRRFTNKDELIRAMLQQRFATEVEPALDRAMADENPWRGMVAALNASLTLAAEEKDVIHAARDPRAVIGEFADRYFGVLAALVRRAQDCGLVRSDVLPEDLPRLYMMLVTAIKLTGQSTGGWRRYLAMVLDGLRPEAAHPLPPAPPLGVCEPLAISDVPRSGSAPRPSGQS